MNDTPLRTIRRSTTPVEGDTWASIARRALPGLDEKAAVSQLQSWNLHVFMRAAGAMAAPGGGNPILPSDVVFVEPPLAT